MLATILPYITIGSAVLMIAAVLLQQRGAGFGSTGEFYTTRRGFDKNLFDSTIVLAVIFVASIIVTLFL